MQIDFKATTKTTVYGHETRQRYIDWYVECANDAMSREMKGIATVIGGIKSSRVNNKKENSFYFSASGERRGQYCTCLMVFKKLRKPILGFYQKVRDSIK